MDDLTAGTLESAQKALGHRIRSLRKQKGWSQEAFARMCGLDLSYLHQIEQGENNLPCSTLLAIAEKLDTTVSSLLEGIA